MKRDMNIMSLEEKLSRRNPTVKVKSKLNGTMVCKFWLENDSCKKGHVCEYIHEYIESRIPECPHLQTGMCTKKDCKFKHTKRERPECQLYRNGYCKNGKDCKSEHIKRELCLNYVLGFCPEGPYCKFFHLKSLISKEQDNYKYLIKNFNIP